MWGSQHGGEGSGEKRGEEGGTSPGRLTRTGRWETDVGGGPNTPAFAGGARVKKRGDNYFYIFHTALLYCLRFFLL